MEGREKNRNDRLIAINRDAVQEADATHCCLRSRPQESDVDFFVKYNEAQGRAFEPLRYGSAAQAVRTVRSSLSGVS